MTPTLSTVQYKHSFPVGSEMFPVTSPSALISRAVIEAVNITQVPFPMAYMAAIASLSAAGQGIVNVKSPTGKEGPVNVSSITVAVTGERKSTLEKLFTKGIKAFEKERLKTHQKNLKKYKLKLEFHKNQETVIRASTELNNEKQCNQMVDKLIAHEESKPVKPRLPILICEDITPEALLSSLSENIPNAFLCTSEGGVVFKSRLMSHTPTMNSLWSGDDISVNRKVADSYLLSGARLTMHIMTQPSALNKFLATAADDLEGNGFTSRLLVCAPLSNCGSRYASGIEYPSGNIKAFNDRVIELLTKSAELDDYTSKKTLCFSSEAKTIWLNVYNDIEFKMGPTGMYQYAKGHASKLSENISRLAALLHCFEYSIDEEISSTTLLEAVNLVSYFSGQFMKVFYAPPKFVADANNLIQWFTAYSNSGIRYIKRNNILQYGPKGTRKKKNLDAALAYMRSSYPVAEITSKRSKVIDLWPQYQLDSSKLEQDLSLGVVL
jgi:hypothetical protein